MWHHASFFDLDTADLLEVIPDALRFIEKAHDEYHEASVLVHCHAGVSRSVSVVLAYAMHKDRKTAKAAYGVLKERYPEAHPRPEFIRQLIIFEELGWPLDGISTSQKEVPSSALSFSSSSAPTPSSSSSLSSLRVARGVRTFQERDGKTPEALSVVFRRLRKNKRNESKTKGNENQSVSAQKEKGDDPLAGRETEDVKKSDFLVRKTSSERTKTWGSTLIEATNSEIKPSEHVVEKGSPPLLSCTEEKSQLPNPQPDPETSEDLSVPSMNISSSSASATPAPAPASVNAHSGVEPCPEKCNSVCREEGRGEDGSASIQSKEEGGIERSVGHKRQADSAVPAASSDDPFEEFLVESEEGGTVSPSPSFSFSCRSCRRVLFYSDLLTGHEPKNGGGDLCTSLFVEPLDWMGDLSAPTGKIFCPNTRCKAKLGSYAWSGTKCACGRWEAPGFQVHKSRVDALEGRQSAPARGPDPGSMF
uniref:protein-tyrosine-phosphatase n=1 Tax=Chromera velia CCMP2878 TaxID=1169474 RepID=A0A0G4HYC3_9ALVE|eukprot:Cvel_9471.t1-p1 / transcript=Cvel_9471.t1 / gene=Cvel_9471 / organism=Chromera_velia_CCMP2878 / gene_product=Dual specificity protein phosphatase 12, putative / transcript_product=Dual specificity protein phosphatase 12, putative / location=Cvel_scaffold547:7551-11600(+) / protein_length=476 / sequence_SO=supercontig / SO=protein_coding / is_pseudo=false